MSSTEPEPAAVAAADPLPLPHDVYPWKVSVGYLHWITGLPPGPRIVVELRQHRWMDESHRAATLSFLTRRALVGVWVNDAQVSASSLPPVAASAGALPVARLHRRKLAVVPGLNRVQCRRSDALRFPTIRMMYGNLALYRHLLAAALGPTGTG